MVRVFIHNGDRTNRAKARLKYVLDAWGFENSWAPWKTSSATSSPAAPEIALETRPPFDRLAHIGSHPQKQKGLHWLGVVLPVGKITASRCAASARSPKNSATAISGSRSGRTFLTRASPKTASPRRRRLSNRSGLDQATSIRAGLSRLHRQCRLPARAVRHQASRRGDRALVRSARRSLTARSTSISPAARIPEHSITSATSASSAPRCRCWRTAIRSRAITASSAAAWTQTPPAARSITTSSRRHAAVGRAHAGAYLGHAPRRRKPVGLPAATSSMRSNVFERGGRITRPRRRRSRRSFRNSRRSRRSSAPGSTASSPASCRSTAASTRCRPKRPRR